MRGADVVVEASRLMEPEPLLRTEWISAGALVIPYGTVSAVELDLIDITDKVVVDDWGQAGIGPLGALRAHVDTGRLSEANLHAELGQIVCGDRPGGARPRRRSCSGTGACRRPTSRSARRCWPRPGRGASGRACRTAAEPLQRAARRRRVPLR